MRTPSSNPTWACLLAGWSLCFGILPPAGAANPSLTPHAHLRTTTGLSSASTETFETLFPGAHDPDDPNIALQQIEVGASLRFERHLEGFFAANLFLDEHDDPDIEIEEAFLGLHDLPGGLGLRGGRLLNRIGLHNSVHLHAWDFADQNLPHALLLGEEGLITDGGELALALPTHHDTLLTFSYGKPTAHGHDDEAHEEEHGDHEDEHDAELSPLAADLFTANLAVELPWNDFHIWRGTTSFASGRTEAGNRAEIYALGLEYLWRANGFEPGGRALRLRTEALYRDDAGHDTLGLVGSAVFTAHDKLDLALRADYLDDPRRLRLSPAITFRPLGLPASTDRARAHLRLQYNFDELPEAGNEHTLLLQLGLGWGAH